MKIFLSYKFTGEDPQELQHTLGQILSVLRAQGHTVYCSIEDEAWFLEKKRTNKEIMAHALEQIDRSDLLLAFIRKDEKSEGMLVEIGYALGIKKPFALALKNGVTTTSLAQIADPLIPFETLDDLCEKLITL